MSALYSNDKTREIDQLAAKALGIDSYALMQKAGAAVYAHLKQHTRLLVVTGPGNNGGDGFVVAELARGQGQQVQVLAMQPVERLAGDAAKAAAAYQGEVIDQWPDQPVDCVVDGLFGTGLMREVTGRYAEVIARINATDAQVLAIDIPSGLHGTTGQIMGCAVRADQTVSILARNTGLYTLDGAACTGQVLFADLAVAPEALGSVEVAARLLAASDLQALKDNRADNSHKGSFGHVLTAGGQSGMLGAVLLAGRAVLKSGAGLTTVITDQSHAELIPLHAPELMVSGFAGNRVDEPLLENKRADVLLLGMGMGQSQWSKHLYQQAIRSPWPLVLDADGLNLLARMPATPNTLRIITPHPKEAAHLLGCSLSEVQQDRWQSVKMLANRYQCVAVLKGSGTLISDGQSTWCCPFGNSNLATAGSGDVLAGLVAGIMAQGFSPFQAACLGVLWHALAGQHSAHGLTMTATDLLNGLHDIIH